VTAIRTGLRAQSAEVFPCRGVAQTNDVIASEAKQSSAATGCMDCFVALLLAMTTPEKQRGS
jgi:hypothetical protein